MKHMLESFAGVCIGCTYVVVGVDVYTVVCAKYCIFNILPITMVTMC